MNQGTTSLGIKASNGVVIATEKKVCPCLPHANYIALIHAMQTPSPLVDDSMIEKVALVCPNIGIVYSGMGPDFRVLVQKARKSAQAYWKIYQEYPPTRVLVAEIASLMQSATQSGCARFHQQAHKMKPS